MAEIRWDILNPVDVGAQVQQGFATGAAMVKQVQTRNALRSYLANPDDPQAYNALAYYDPQAAATIQQQQLTRRKLDMATQEEQRRRAVGGMIASGDLQGARASAYGAGDFDLGKSIDEAVEATRKQGKEAIDAQAAKYQALAPLAYQASKLPYEKRKEFLAANQDLLTAAGVAPEEAANFDPTDVRLAGIVGFGSKLSELTSADKPQLVPYVPGGGVAALQDGKLSTLVLPNPGDQPTGAPVVTPGGSGSGIIQKNNPGALRKPGSMQFQSFGSEGEGIKAQEALLGRYMDRGLKNVASIVETYAPRQSRGGDNTDEQVNNYISYVAGRLGVSPQDALSPAMTTKLAAAMREFETGRRPKGPASGHSPAEIKAAAQRAIAQGADPSAVRARAAAQGVTL